MNSRGSAGAATVVRRCLVLGAAGGFVCGFAGVVVWAAAGQSSSSGLAGGLAGLVVGLILGGLLAPVLVRLAPLPAGPVERPAAAIVAAVAAAVLWALVFRSGIDGPVMLGTAVSVALAAAGAWLSLGWCAQPLRGQAGEAPAA